ncbi:MAG: DUF4399 domain-containing protein [Roseivirga sp.]|nr:DUF4399 domain-containing protein [Roseivirga sp.]
MKYFKSLLAVALVAVFLVSCAGEEGVDFGNLKDGDSVSTTFKVTFEVSGKSIRPAGTEEDGTGHHHIIIDDTFVAAGTVVPADDTHIHFGKGQTETELTLTPGSHTLTLQFADYAHRSFGGKWSKTITVNVE